MIAILIAALLALIGFVAYWMLMSKSTNSSSTAAPKNVSKPSASRSVPTPSVDDEDEVTRVRVAGPRLIRTMGGLKVGDEMPISNAMTIGRGQGSTIRLNDAELSSIHAEFRMESGLPVVTDMGSTNGTFVNSERIEPHISVCLKDGDQIKIGATNLVFKASQ